MYYRLSMRHPGGWVTESYDIRKTRSRLGRSPRGLPSLLFILPVAIIRFSFHGQKRKKEVGNPGSLNLERTTNDAPRERACVAFMALDGEPRCIDASMPGDPRKIHDDASPVYPPVFHYIPLVVSVRNNWRNRINSVKNFCPTRERILVEQISTSVIIYNYAVNYAVN